jgi:hypothetical protein
MPKASTHVEILQGTLDMLILKAVSLGPLHGYGVLFRLQQISKEAFQIPQGSLYPALYRLEHGGFIKSEGERARITAAPSTTNSPPRGVSGCEKKPHTGAVCRKP